MPDQYQVVEIDGVANQSWFYPARDMAIARVTQRLIVLGAGWDVTEKAGHEGERWVVQFRITRS